MTDFGHNRLLAKFDLLCVCVVLCVVCVAWVLFHGVRCGCWFQGLVWTTLPLDRTKFRSSSPAAKFVLFLPSLGVSR